MSQNGPSINNGTDILFQRRKYSNGDFEYIFIHFEDEASFIAFYDSNTDFPTKIWSLREFAELSIEPCDVSQSEATETSSEIDEMPWKQVRVNSLFPERWAKPIIEQIKTNKC